MNLKIALTLVLFRVVLVHAQLGPCSGTKAGTTACLIPQVLGPTAASVGVTLSPAIPTGNAVIVTPFAASAPVPSTASGFVYNFDSSSGAYTRSSESFGPIMAERAETIGKKKLFLGYAFQHFVFDKVDGTSTHTIRAVIPAGTGLINETVNFSLSMNQSTFFAAYGITDRLDVSVAIPFSSVHAAIVENGVFLPGQASVAPTNLFGEGAHTATGLSDIDLQFKGTVVRKEAFALALGTTIRLPTGNAYEALGAGTTGVKPFVAGSVSYKRVSPHVDFGYLLNGSSILSGNILLDTKRQLPDQFQYAAGIDAGVTKRLTVAFDMLGTEVIHGDRLTQDPNAPSPFYRKSYNMTNASIGAKVNLVGKLLFMANVLLPVNDAGLRSKVVPLVGVSYAF